MSKRTVFTTVTPLEPGITRDAVLQTLHDHVVMIDLNPLVIDRHRIKPPATACPEEYHCQWYQLTDRVQYLPGGLYSGKVSYNVCFHDLAKGLQTHCYAPAGLDIKGKWTVGGSMPGEPQEPTELGLGLPKHGLWLREDVDMRCNVLMTGFVKKTLKKAHSSLVARLVQKAHIIEADWVNDKASQRSSIPSSFRPGHQSASYSDASSLRSSYVSQSPGMQQEQFAPTNNSPPYPVADPAFGDTHRDLYTAPPQQKSPMYSMPDALLPPPPPPKVPYPSYAAELPVQSTTPVELPTSASPQQHELPARLYDHYR